MSCSTVDPAAIRTLTLLCSWNVRNIHQWHWVFSSWSNSCPVVEGREKMGVRIDREEESLVCCFLSFFTEKVITPVSIILNGKWLSLIFPFIITKNRTLPWAGTPPLPILPFATLMCISWVYMSCFLALRWLQLWDLLPKGSMRIGSFSFEMSPGQKQKGELGRDLFSAPLLWSCSPTWETVGKLRTCQRGYTVRCMRARERQAFLVWVRLHQVWSFK